MFKLLKKIIPISLKRAIRIRGHHGTKYQCPFCNFCSKDLAIIGLDIPVLSDKKVVGAGRRAAGCFSCGSTDRERLIYAFLKEKTNYLNSDKDRKILHIAPEKNLSKLLIKSGFTEYVCGDLFTEGYKYPAHVKNINVLNIPYHDEYFDLVICNHVLEHIPDDIAAMKELSRVLKKDGLAILQVPISLNSSLTSEDFSVTNSKERKKMFGQFDHVRIYGQDYLNRLKKSRFKVEALNISADYPTLGLNNDEVLFLCRK